MVNLYKNGVYLVNGTELLAVSYTHLNTDSSSSWTDGLYI